MMSTGPEVSDSDPHVLLPPKRPTSDAEFPAYLSAPRSVLIGRDHDLAVARELLLRDDVPLVTLSGPGGVGKTRLALAVAADVAPGLANGVIFVRLVSLRDPALVLPTIANACGLHDTGSQPILDRLIWYLRPRQLLLVLDNFEQVIDAAPSVAHLLAECPSLKVMATSRVVLHLTDEQNVPVAPLATPELTSQSSFEDSTAYPAVQLFVARGRAVNPDFSLTEHNAAAVAAICRRLDGLPLALELAAARVRALPPAALLVHLEHSLALLTDGPRDQPDRLRTTRDAIAWSYDLLDAPERALFRRLSVFVGGFDVEATEAIDLPGTATFNGIATLINASLVRQIAGPLADAPRFRMLETVREFGQERLAEYDEDQTFQAAHARHFLTLAEQTASHVFAPDYARMLDRLVAEHDNIRAALTWADSAGETEISLRMTSALGSFWIFRGYFREGRAWLERALERGASDPASLRAGALSRAGWLANLQGDIGSAEALLLESIDVVGSTGDDWLVAMGLLGMTLVDLQRNDPAEASAWTKRALAVYLDLRDVHPAAPHFVSVAYANLGQSAQVAGDYAQSATYLDEALRRQRALDFRWGLSDTLRILGDLTSDLGQHDLALVHYRDDLALVADHGDQRFLAENLAGIAGVMSAKDQPERAARYLGAAAALRQKIGASIEGWERPTYERRLALARAALAPEAFESAWTDGSVLPAVTIIAEALIDADPAVAPPADIDPAITAGLTTREREVLLLLAGGLRPRGCRGTPYQPPDGRWSRLQPAGQAGRRYPDCRCRLGRLSRHRLTTPEAEPRISTPYPSGPSGEPRMADRAVLTVPSALLSLIRCSALAESRHPSIDGAHAGPGYVTIDGYRPGGSWSRAGLCHGGLAFQSLRSTLAERGT